MDEITATSDTLTDEDIRTVVPDTGVPRVEQPGPRDEDGTDTKDADGTDGDTTDGTDGDASDADGSDADGSDTQDADGTDASA